MRIKSGINKKRDIMYIVVAIILTLLLSAYLFWLVNGLADKANEALSANSNKGNIPTFDFERYDKLMKNVLTKPATST